MQRTTNPLPRLGEESEVIDIKSTYKERIKKLEGRVDKLEEENRVLRELHSVYSKVDIVAPVVKNEKSFKHGRIIADIDEDVEINLEEAQTNPYRMDLEHPEKVLSMQDVDDEDPVEVEEVLEVVTAAKLITEVVTTTGATTTVEATKVSVLRRRRDVVIQDPEETTSIVVVHSEVQSKDKGKELNADINWNVVIEEVKRSERFNDAVMKYQTLKRNPLTEAQARKNMIIYLKNMEVNEEVTIPEKEVEVKGHKREGKSLEKEITKKQKMDEEAEELNSHLQIVSNDDDDVYIEATPLASKIPIVDYKIHLKRNKPYFKIIRADGNHMLFLSFSILLKNFDREDLESLWKLVIERFKKTKPKNYTDENLLKTLKTMFEQPDVEASVWIDQKTYPLTHFTLEQMLNNVRLEVKEEGEMSLELLRDSQRPKHSGVIWKKKGSSNTSSVDLSSISHSKLNKYVKRYSRKNLLSCNNFYLGETSGAYVCNDAMNVSCNSRLYDSFDENNLFIFDDESVRNSQVSKMPFRKKPNASLNVPSRSKLNKSLPRITHKWLPKFQPTPQQNGVVERRNRTLVEAARTMLTCANLPLFLWAEAIVTACFRQNCLIIHKCLDKTPYELMNKRKTNIKFFHVFGCRRYLLNDYDDVGKLKAKGDIGVFVGYLKESAAFRIYNKRTRIFSSSLNDDVYQSLEEVTVPSSNTQSVSNNMVPNVDEASTSHNMFNECLEDAYFDASTSFHDPSNPANVAEALRDADWVSAMQEELDQFARLKVWRLVPRTEVGYSQQEGINYDETFAPVTRIKAIRLLLAYAAHKDFTVFQMM
uniref:Retrovirus-related Pol polyprotein from transposon TNT 1-94 n=1 Tax=Tanacetum cinerariifolium TaxID=118510 RepID=A0A699I494_TANCI|nr:retrovirus-related Pol polyprotein from transposon TNT 1-94 [Tanacetum cinerariifolium]